MMLIKKKTMHACQLNCIVTRSVQSEERKYKVGYFLEASENLHRMALDILTGQNMKWNEVR